MKKTAIAMAVLSLPTLVMAEPLALCRLVSTSLSDHFYTTDPDELVSAMNGPYVFEGISGFCFSTREAGTVPLYRLWSDERKLGDHFYTTSVQEVDSALSGGAYVYQGVACYVYPQPKAGACPFYRLTTGTDHFYTESWQEALGAMQNNNYQYEGVAAYLLPPQEGGSCPP